VSLFPFPSRSLGKKAKEKRQRGRRLPTNDFSSSPLGGSRLKSFGPVLMVGMYLLSLTPQQKDKERCELWCVKEKIRYKRPTKKHRRLFTKVTKKMAKKRKQKTKRKTEKIKWFFFSLSFGFSSVHLFQTLEKRQKDWMGKIKC
jgi:hypothetical protein